MQRADKHHLLSIDYETVKTGLNEIVKETKNHTLVSRTSSRVVPFNEFASSDNFYDNAEIT
jgi:hypothetical protein